MLPRLALALAALALAVPGAHAATPKGGELYVVHDHQTPGDNWHVEAKVAKSATRLKSLVLYAERCGEHTPFALDVPVGADGSVAASGPLDADAPATGSFEFSGRFVQSHRLDGEFRFVTPECDTGPMLFVAHSGKGHRHFTSGPAFGTKPDLSAGTDKARGQALWLWRTSMEAARERFTSYRRSRALGFRRYPRHWRRPVLFHVRHSGYARDRRWFDARRPESLVYWWPPKGEGSPVLVAFMYRRPVGSQPAFAKPLLGWHSHDTSRKATQMTHVWVVPHDLRSALANCMPVPELELALPAFDFRADAMGLGHESAPCPAGA